MIDIIYSKISWTELAAGIFPRQGLYCLPMIFEVYGTPICFSAIFVKGNIFCDFLWASLDNVALPKWGPL